MNYSTHSKQCINPTSCHYLIDRFFIKFVFAVAIFYSPSIQAATPEIHTSKGRNGIEFKHFEYILTPENTLLSADNISRAPINENSEQFEYGQFEILIPVKEINLASSCQRYYLVRMPQSLDLNKHHEIKDKQNLFFKIKEMLENKKGEIPVIFEYPKGCNIFFRATNGRYIDYVGQLKD